MKNKNTIQVILLPKGYGKATKEVRDYVHLLEQENEKFKEYYLENVNKYEELIEKYSNLQERINNAIDYINNHWDLATDKNLEFCILRDRVFQILKR